MLNLQNYLDPRELTLHNLIRQKLTKYIKEPKVTIITSTNKAKYMDNIFQNYSCQNIKNKELIIILNNNSLQLPEWRKRADQLKNVQVFQLDESVSLGECLNYAVDRSSGEYIAKFDDDDYYAPNYYSDMLCCFLFTEAAVVGKVSHFVYFEKTNILALTNKGRGFSYIDFLSGGTHVIRRDVFTKVKFEKLNLSEDFYFNHQCNLNNLKLYASGPLNYVRVRSTNQDDHTWKIDDQEYIAGCETIGEFKEFRPLVTD